MTATAHDAPPLDARVARPRRFLMCRPQHFDVTYAINPWMHPGQGVDAALAVRQWEALRATYRDLGHRVDLVEPVPGLPDMVFAANGATVIGGRVLGSSFAFPQRAGEAAAYGRWLVEHGLGPVVPPVGCCEAEGDLVLVGDLLLAGTGYRTERSAHAQAEDVFGLPVVSLELVDPRFYHLDTALFALDDHNVAYHPAAFGEGSRAALETLFPDAVVASEADALVLGLNAVSDGRHVVLAAQAEDLAAQVAARGYVPVPVDLSELRRAGGGPKCCTMEIREARS